MTELYGYQLFVRQDNPMKNEALFAEVMDEMKRVLAETFGEGEPEDMVGALVDVSVICLTPDEDGQMFIELQMTEDSRTQLIVDFANEEAYLSGEHILCGTKRCFSFPHDIVRYIY
jgi:hypothetical protein